MLLSCSALARSPAGSDEVDGVRALAYGDVRVVCECWASNGGERSWTRWTLHARFIGSDGSGSRASYAENNDGSSRVGLRKNNVSGRANPDEPGLMQVSLDSDGVVSASWTHDPSVGMDV